MSPRHTLTQDEVQTIVDNAVRDSEYENNGESRISKEANELTRQEYEKGLNYGPTLRTKNIKEYGDE